MVDAANEAQTPATARWLLSILLNLAKDGSTEIAIADLAPYYGGHQSNVIKQLRVLKKKKLIQTAENPGGAGKINVYTFPFLDRNAEFKRPIAPVKLTVRKDGSATMSSADAQKVAENTMRGDATPVAIVPPPRVKFDVPSDIPASLPTDDLENM